MHKAPKSRRYSWLTNARITLRQEVEDSRTENSWDVLFVAVAVYLWTDKRYVAHVLTKGACYFSYMRTSLNCSFVGAVRLFPDDVSNILALSSG